MFPTRLYWAEPNCWARFSCSPNGWAQPNCWADPQFFPNGWAQPNGWERSDWPNKARLETKQPKLSKTSMDSLISYNTFFFRVVFDSPIFNLPSILEV